MGWNIKRWLVTLTISSVVVGISYLAYTAWQFSRFLDANGPCMMSAGPFRGTPIIVSPDTIDADYTFATEAGDIVITHSNDSASEPELDAPLMFLVGHDRRVRWAYTFDSVRADIGLIIDEADLDPEKHTIHFFNAEFMEPATFYFDDDWNFEYLCQSSM